MYNKVIDQDEEFDRNFIKRHSNFSSFNKGIVINNSFSNFNKSETNNPFQLFNFSNQVIKGYEHIHSSSVLFTPIVTRSKKDLFE